MTRFLAHLGLLLVAGAIGCGGGDDAEKKKDATPVADGCGDGCGSEGCGDGDPCGCGDGCGEAEAPEVTNPGILKGVVRFEGKPPKRRKIDMDAEPFCNEKRPQKLRDESVIVNEDGTLRNVFVWIKKGIRGRFPPPKEAVLIDQAFCQYIPHVVGVQVRQKLVIRNSDPVMHNIHSYSSKKQEFNEAQSKEGMETEFVFKRPEVMMSLKCDVHGWMGAYIGIVRHPFFQVTGDGGAFELKDVPPGSYTLEAWHEVYGTKTVDVTLGAGETKQVDFTFQKK